MLINCAIGERGAKDEVDDALMSRIDLATIACGGHAGDKESVSYYQELAQKHGVKTVAYLSYPKKEKLSKDVTSITHEELLGFLDEQAELFGPMQRVKLQGELYNHANRSVELAEQLALWLKNKDVKEVLTPYRSMLHKLCSDQGIAALYEAFADKKYTSMQLGLELSSQDQIGSEIKNIDDIIRQVRKMKQGAVEINGQNFLIEAATICVDSSAPQVVETVDALVKVLNK